MSQRTSLSRRSYPPVLPKPLSALSELAANLWWTWDSAAPKLWERLDPRLWKRTGHNPSLMLRRISPRRFRRLAEDKSLLAEVRAAGRRMRHYLLERTWFQKQYGRRQRGLMAYFSMEFGLHESLPIYAGGLGILAGDHMKSASDLGLPLVGLGMFWRQGYTRQRVDAAGRQADWFKRVAPEDLPVSEVTGPAGRPLRERVPMGRETVAIRAWRVEVGRTCILLLDTDLPENPPRHRRLTDRLYAGDRDTRIRQEVVLGIGGWRVLRALKWPVVACHLNEGHAAFCCLERLDEIVRENGCDIQEACRRVAASGVFTTHTPVPEGNEVFAPDLVEKYVGHYGRRLGIGIDGLLSFGFAGSESREGWCEKGFSHQRFSHQRTERAEPFGMTPLALRLCDHRNGVSKLHGAVSRRMWQGLWPRRQPERVPIGSITNGVHAATWLHPKMTELLNDHLPRNWPERHDLASVWAAAKKIPDRSLWETHIALKAELLDFVRDHLRAEPARGGANQARIRAAGADLDPQALTIGFARRFTAYKRAALIFADVRRLAKLINDPRRPVQLIFAGKAHPADFGGKALVAEIVRHARSGRFKGRIVFLEDYDMSIARRMVAGVDVWLNNPQRPKEASGTSGMKPALHGGLNLSILDGWWPEGCDDGKNGWAVGRGEDHDGSAAADRRDAAALYRRLERDVIPMYYRLDRRGLPAGWIRMMKHALATIPPMFNTHRMVKDYCRRYYLPAIRNCSQG